MDRNQIIEKISETLGGIIDDDDLRLTPEMTADDVDEWDSLNHVKLIVALEAEFGVRFETEEITAPRNVGELADLIAGKL